MSKYWIPISLMIIGYFGFLWIMGLSTLSNINIDITMDNNTLKAVQSINSTTASILKENNRFMIFNETDCQYINNKKEYWCVKHINKNGVNNETKI